MLGRLTKSARPTNGTNGASKANGANGTNGNDHDEANRHQAPAPHSSIELAAGYRWTLEVRNNQQLLGSMYSSNPFVLINFFREYTVLYGAPAGDHAVWLRHRQTDHGAPLHPMFGEAQWLEFLRSLDPQLDEHLADMRACEDRTSMIDAAGRSIYPDAILEVAFTQAGRSAAAPPPPA
jgi:hypothetical protein